MFINSSPSCCCCTFVFSPTLCYPWSFVLAFFRFIPLALTLSVSLFSSPLSLPVWPLLLASPGNHAHQATLQAPFSAFQTSFSFISPLLSLLSILLFSTWPHVTSLHSAQTHVLRRYPHRLSPPGQRHEMEIEGPTLALNWIWIVKVVKTFPKG